MDERYWLYAEDIDWCHRFWDEGWKVLYWPGVEVTHRKGGSSGDIRSWELNRAFHRSMWLFYAKHVAPRTAEGGVRARVGGRVDEVRPLGPRERGAATTDPRLERRSARRPIGRAPARA